IFNSARAARDLLEKRGATYSDRPRFVLFNELIESFKPNMALLSYGDEWRKHRKWFQMALSSRVSLDSYCPMQRYAAGVFMEISYGHTVTSVDDKFIRMADEAGAEILENWRQVYANMVTGPGSFKRRALELGQFTRDTMSLPYENVKAEMASGSARPSYTATLLTSFVLAMVLYPEVYRKAQTEMDAVVRQSRLPNPDDRPMLPYLECVLKEVLRWCCPAPLGEAMMQDADVYSDPEAFNPDSFRDITDDTGDALDPHTIVFGFGRRICPGCLLADSNAWLVAANLVATMDIRRECDSSGQKIIPVPVFTSGTVRHPHPFPCKIHPHSNKAVHIIGESNDEVEA
ncbi:cytochrome P450, partial [Laetiporus sulphureus 93-53]